MNEPEVIGAVSKIVVNKLGTGTTSRKTKSQIYYYAERDLDGNYQIRTLSNNSPVGKRTVISQEEFERDFIIENEVNKKKIFPKLEDCNDKLNTADEFRGQEKYYSAENEYTQVLDFDESQIRANFGLGITYFAQAKKVESRAIFKELKGLESLFDSTSIYMLNEFGMKLRRTKLYEDAIAFYMMALNLVTTDENLYFNVARVFYDKQEFGQTHEMLDCALQINANHLPALKFKTFLDARH